MREVIQTNGRPKPARARMSLEQLEERCLLSGVLSGAGDDHAVGDACVNTTAAEVASAEPSSRAAVTRGAPAIADFSGTWNITTDVGNGTANLTQVGKKVTGTIMLNIPELGVVTLDVKASVKKDGKLVGKAQVTVPGEGTIRFGFTGMLLDANMVNGTAKVKIPGEPTQQGVAFTMTRVLT